MVHYSGSICEPKNNVASDLGETIMYKKKKANDVLLRKKAGGEDEKVH